MKAFFCFALVAVVAADQSHHQVVKHGNAPSVSVSVHKPHGAAHASVVSQPHAAPQAVNAYHNSEKYSAAVHSPAAVPSYIPAPAYKAAPVYKSAPVYKAPVPAYKAAPAPAYKSAPAPAYNAAPARAYKAAPAPSYKAAPAPA